MPDVYDLIDSLRSSLTSRMSKRGKLFVKVSFYTFAIAFCGFVLATTPILNATGGVPDSYNWLIILVDSLAFLCAGAIVWAIFDKTRLTRLQKTEALAAALGKDAPELSALLEILREDQREAMKVNFFFFVLGIFVPILLSKIL